MGVPVPVAPGKEPNAVQTPPARMPDSIHRLEFGCDNGRKKRRRAGGTTAIATHNAPALHRIIASGNPTPRLLERIPLGMMIGVEHSDDLPSSTVECRVHVL